LKRRREAQRQRFGAVAGDEARRFNRMDKAIAHYEIYLKRRPRDLGVRLRLISVLREVGRTREAEALLRTLVARRPHDLKILAMLAETLDEAGAPENAQRLYAAILSKDPANEAVRQASARIRQALETSSTPLARPPSDHPRYPQGEVTMQKSELRLAAGATLLGEAQEWFDWAIRQDATAVYADHQGPNGELRLQAAPHLFELATNPYPPAAVMFAHGFLRPAEDTRAGLARALEQGSVLHVPLVLSRIETEAESEAHISACSADHRKLARLLVVVPTRDAVEELTVMLRSLVALAARADLIDLVVVDNGSRPAMNAEALSRGCGKLVEIVLVDEPFNWSRLNNLASAGRSQSIFIFANNDMEMLTPRWDETLRQAFCVSGIGVVGARLVYPNGLLQHGGIVMGGLNGEPVHDGWRMPGDEPGPLHRWARSRPATAVTGGFLAIKRTLFEAVGGFDEVELPVSCSDVDLCLKAGALGWTVLYVAEIELRHHESLTRGHSYSEEERRRAAEEMQTLLRRWGERAAYDSTRNPQWASRGLRLYAGRRALTTEQVVDWALKTKSCGRELLG
jgi:GT2 family glycosyltransferase/tetratricopeptide (TPR) repeat protein